MATHFFFFCTLLLIHSFIYLFLRQQDSILLTVGLKLPHWLVLCWFHKTQIKSRCYQGCNLYMEAPRMTSLPRSLVLFKELNSKMVEGLGFSFSCWPQASNYSWFLGSKSCGMFTIWSIIQQLKKTNIPFAATWMELEGTVLTEISQKEKDKCWIESLLCWSIDTLKKRTRNSKISFYYRNETSSKGGKRGMIKGREVHEGKWWWVIGSRRHMGTTIK